MHTLDLYISRSGHSLCKLSFALILIFGMTLSSPALSARGEDDDSSKPETDTFYSMTFGRTGLELVVTQYWSKGPLLRSVTVVAGHPIVSIVNGKKYYTYDALTREGYEIRRSASAIAKDDERPRPFALDLEDLLAQGGEMIREETLNGIRTEVYRVTDQGGRRTLWVTQNKSKFPVKMESYNRSSGRTGELDWVQWVPGLTVDKDFFEIPKKLDLRRFDDYPEYLEALKEGPIPPSPPLFFHLLHQPDES